MEYEDQGQELRYSGAIGGPINSRDSWKVIAVEHLGEAFKWPRTMAPQQKAEFDK